MVKINVYCLEWHIKKSSAFQNLVSDPLSAYAEVKMHSWDGTSIGPSNIQNGPMVFCQLPPNAEIFDRNSRLVWIPMWDHARNYPQSWWNALPKSLRIVAFSKQVAKKAAKAGLPILSLQFFKDPERFGPADWDNKRVLMYWNRTGMIGPDFLEKFCNELNIDKLFFRLQIDPRVAKKAEYNLPKKLGETVIEHMSAFSSGDEYFAAFRQANIFIAPRLFEGAGMTFIEALAKGCAVFAANCPTMNEYIISGENGYLLKTPRQKDPHSLSNRIIRRLHLPVNRQIKSVHPVNLAQDWDSIRSLDLEKLGRKARQMHYIGYEQWQSSIPKFADFILK